MLLALHRAGTLAGAAASLGVDASTVGRRIDALEGALGARLFERTPDGALPTSAADELVAHAEAMERAAHELAGSASGFERDVEGVVRISVPPGVSDFLVAPRLRALLAAHPRLRIELDARVGYVDLARRAADLALRAARPERGDLVVLRVGHAVFIPFVSRELGAELGRVRDAGALPWITYGRELEHISEARWVSRVAREERIVLRTSSFASQVFAAESGLGVILGADALLTSRGLVRLAMTKGAASRLPPYPDSSLYLVAHRASRSVPRVAAVWDYFASGVSKAQPRR